MNLELDIMESLELRQAILDRKKELARRIRVLSENRTEWTACIGIITNDLKMLAATGRKLSTALK